MFLCRVCVPPAAAPGSVLLWTVVSLQVGAAAQAHSRPPPALLLPPPKAPFPRAPSSGKQDSLIAVLPARPSDGEDDQASPCGLTVCAVYHQL